MDIFVFLAQHRNGFLYPLIMQYVCYWRCEIKYECALISDWWFSWKQTTLQDPIKTCITVELGFISFGFVLKTLSRLTLTWPDAVVSVEPKFFPAAVICWVARIQDILCLPDICWFHRRSYRKITVSAARSFQLWYNLVMHDCMILAECFSVLFLKWALFLNVLGCKRLM